MTVQTIDTLTTLVSPTGSLVALLRAFEGSWTQDEGASPSMIATVVVAAPTAAQYAMMRPGSGYYLGFAGEHTFIGAPVPYLWRIVSRERTMDGRVRLQATSPEIDLQNYRPSAVDRSNWANQGDVSSIIYNVLDKVYGPNRAGRWTYGNAFGQDIGVRPYPTYQAVTNLAKNPRLGVDSAGWVATSSGGTLSRGTNGSASYPFQNYARLGIGSGSTSGTGIAYQQAAPFEAGRRYTFMVYGQVAKSGGNLMSARLIWKDANGNEVGGRSYATTRRTVADWTQRFTITATAPLGAAAFDFTFYAGTGAAAWVSGDVMYASALMIVEGDGLETDGGTPLLYFDGDADNGQRGYNYSWQDTANASPSARTPLVDRDPDSLTWSPKQSAWDFLTPILQTVGVRLWADAYDKSAKPGDVVPRYYWALNEFGFTSTARRALQGVNLLDVTQLDSFTAEFPDGSPMYADQVIIHYSWTDAADQDREAYDVYPATGKKPYYLELENTPYAGAGRAKGIYNRISARTTMLQGVMWFDRGTFPGKQLALTADALGGSVVGYIDSTTHDPFRGTTEFRTKQTIAYTNASWFAATGSWASQTGSWAADI